MAISRIVSLTEALGTNGGTSSSIDTTGATFLVVFFRAFSAFTLGNFSDNKGNTWLSIPDEVVDSSYSNILYCINPTVGTGHTFSYSGSGNYISVTIAGYTGVDNVVPFNGRIDSLNVSDDQTSGSTTTAVALKSFSNDSLMIANAVTSNAHNDLTVGDGFDLFGEIQYSVGNHMGGAAADLFVNTKLTTYRPTFTSSTSVSWLSQGVSFRPTRDIPALKETKTAREYPGVIAIPNNTVDGDLLLLFMEGWSNDFAIPSGYTEHLSENYGTEGILKIATKIASSEGTGLDIDTGIVRCMISRIDGGIAIDQIASNSYLNDNTGYIVCPDITPTQNNTLMLRYVQGGWEQGEETFTDLVQHTLIHKSININDSFQGHAMYLLEDKDSNITDTSSPGSHTEYADSNNPTYDYIGVTFNITSSASSSGSQENKNKIGFSLCLSCNEFDYNFNLV